MSGFIDLSPETMTFEPLFRLPILSAPADYDHLGGRKPIILLNPDGSFLLNEVKLQYSFTESLSDNEH